MAVDVVVVDVLDGMTGTKARTFQWLAMKQANFCQFPPWLVQGWFQPEEVSVLVEVVVVDVVELPLWHPPWVPNGPVMPMAMRLTVVDPVLAT